MQNLVDKAAGSVEGDKYVPSPTDPSPEALPAPVMAGGAGGGDGNMMEVNNLNISPSNHPPPPSPLPSLPASLMGTHKISAITLGISDSDCQKSTVWFMGVRTEEALCTLTNTPTLVIDHTHHMLCSLGVLKTLL
ncbi:hypothetical protein E2C01_057398 [Portunus trituberculatus]|uniref:Uncharacterized protein n=1 Tax=Portunus trituberculatus TaxID=210409 RepID=A0A5B7GSS5_PORTR|nr:hypothetical protein [Portunus trituberculatus]